MGTVRDIICSIDEKLCKVFSGSKWYGVTELIDKDGKSQPQAGHFDDGYRLSGYHRILEITPRRTGFNYQNTYSCILIISNTTGLPGDEIAGYLQTVIGSLNIQAARVTLTKIILNSQQVFAAEYRGHTFPGIGLIQINYTVEAAFKEICCDIPEDCLTNKLN